MMASASRSTARVKSALDADTAVTTRWTSARTLDLEAVRAVVPHGVGIEELIEIGHELQEIHDHIVPQTEVNGGGMCELNPLFLLGVLALGCASPAHRPTRRRTRDSASAS